MCDEMLMKEITRGFEVELGSKKREIKIKIRVEEKEWAPNKSDVRDKICIYEPVKYIVLGDNSKRKFSGYEEKIENRKKTNLCNHY